VDAIAKYRAASEANDIDGIIDTLAPDVEFVSPLTGLGVVRGKDDLRVLFGAVYGTLSGLRWREEIRDGERGVVIGYAFVGPLRVDDAMVFELDRDGRIKHIRPHLRPWLATTVLALTLFLKIGRHPGVVWRAIRRS
jgi:hypothetical protein